MNYKRKSRKFRAFKRKMVMMILAVILFCNIGIFSGMMISSAKESSENQLFKYYSVIDIEYGDTLDKIAGEYADVSITDPDEYIDEIIFINHLESDKICAGQKLVIPYYSHEFK